MKRISKIFIFIISVTWILWGYGIYLQNNFQSQIYILSSFLKELLKSPFIISISLEWISDFIFSIIFLFSVTLVGFFIVKKLFPHYKFILSIATGFLLSICILSIIWELLAIFFILNKYTIILSLLTYTFISYKFPFFYHFSQKISMKKSSEKKIAKITILSLIIFINFFIFYWAIFFPVKYWDGLILYVNYAKETFLNHGYPIRVCLEVGDGLGANYPHLYPTIAASIAILADKWDDLFSRIIPPIMGIITQIFIYFTILKLTKKSLYSLLGVLLFRIIPYGIAYNIFASDYATAIAFTAGFFYFITSHYFDKNPIDIIIAGLIASTSTHINYLMWSLWGIFFLYTLHYSIINQKLKKGILIITIMLLIASIWYVRNYIITGNPVYAFYYKIFGGKNINPMILEFCENEWKHNGDGIGNGLYGKTFWEKLKNSYFFWISNKQTGWKLNPVLICFVIPGIFFSIYKTLKKQYIYLYFLLYTAGLLFYHYFISGYYLYHIITLLPLFAIFSIEFFRILPYKNFFIFIIFSMSIIPGIAMSIYGFKITRPSKFYGKVFTFAKLFKYPGINNFTYWQIVYPEARVWLYIKNHIPDAKILTHENRYLCLPNRNNIYHLDGCKIQKVYSLSLKEKLKYLKKLGITHYLYIKNEDNLVNNKGEKLRKYVGIDEFIKAGFLKEIYTSSGREAILYKFSYQTIKN